MIILGGYIWGRELTAGERSLLERELRILYAIDPVPGPFTDAELVQLAELKLEGRKVMF